VMAGSAVLALAGALFVVFAAAIRRILREAGDDDTIPTIALAGAIIFAVGAAASGTISFAAADLVDDVDALAINTINAIAWDWFLAFAAGLLLFFLATGIGIVRTGALPKWLGWIAILIGVVALTPIGFGAAIAGAVWILVASIVIGMRGSTA
ncbi:MAG: hypothetical protein M3O25_08525, partial [Actinomycetota bacterium]|nr:hypothetical protein [Actinomycetota bacterium]